MNKWDAICGKVCYANSKRVFTLTLEDAMDDAPWQPADPVANLTVQVLTPVIHNGKIDLDFAQVIPLEQMEAIADEGGGLISPTMIVHIDDLTPIADTN